MDDSELSKQAFENALDLAGMTGGEVTVMHVIEPIPFLYHDLSEDEISAPYLGSIEENDARVDSMLQHYVAHGKEWGVDVHKLIRKGNVPEEIIRASSNFDIIIIGTLGRNALSSLLLGSTAEKVSRYACCPVMLVREVGSECRI